MLKLFRKLSECRDRAMQAMEQSEADGSAYHDALDKNRCAHDTLMEKIDRRSPNRKMSAA